MIKTTCSGTISGPPTDADRYMLRCSRPEDFAKFFEAHSRQDKKDLIDLIIQIINKD